MRADAAQFGTERYPPLRGGVGEVLGVDDDVEQARRPLRRGGGGGGRGGRGGRGDGGSPRGSFPPPSSGPGREEHAIVPGPLLPIETQGSVPGGRVDLPHVSPELVQGRPGDQIGTPKDYREAAGRSGHGSLEDGIVGDPICRRRGQSEDGEGVPIGRRIGGGGGGGAAAAAGGGPPARLRRPEGLGGGGEGEGGMMVPRPPPGPARGMGRGGVGSEGGCRSGAEEEGEEEEEGRGEGGGGRRRHGSRGDPRPGWVHAAMGDGRWATERY